jgi:RNA polymerase-binding transcription factor DksA
MARLTQEQKAALKEQLTARRADLFEEIRTKMAESRAHTGTGQVDQWSEAGEAALATLIASTDFEMARRDIEEVREVNVALARIDERDFGECEDCGSSIGYERLHAYPSAIRCVHCQGAFEQRRGRGRGASL